MNHTWLLLALLGWAACGRVDFDPIGAVPDAEIVIDPCDMAGACDRIVTRNISCSNGTTSSDQICTAAGFGPAIESVGYAWFQCGGPITLGGGAACPTGWDNNELACASWCGGSDCVGVPYCGGGQIVHEKSTAGSTTFDPLENGYNCTGYNPGWIVRVRCVALPKE